MATYQKIIDDLKNSMLAKDELKTSTLRMAKAEIMKVEKSGVDVEISEDMINQVIKKMVKQRIDSAEQFKQGGRNELAEKEEREIELLKTYLPEEMSEEEVKEVVRNTITELNISGKSEMGKLMGMVMGKLKGKADGTLVKKVVESELE